MDQEVDRKRILIEEEYESRRRSDPLLSWEPTPKQRPFINAVLEGPTWENWLIAANRCGKSDAGASCGAQLARFGHPEPRPSMIGDNMAIFDRATSGWVVSLDFPSSRDIIQPKYFDNGLASTSSHPPFIPAREIAKDGWRVSDQVLKLKNGSIIGFKSGDSGREKFQGTDKDFVHFDEEPKEDIYEESVIRVGAGRRLRVFGTCTILPPDGQVGGVSWLFPKMILPWQSGEKRHVGLFGASIYDNPHLDRQEIARLEAVYPEGSPQRRIRLGGEWLPGIGGARAYGNFDRRLHVRPQLGITPRRPLCWIWDFNVEPLVTLIGQREMRSFRVLQEMVLDEGAIGEMVEWFRSEIPSHIGEVWIYGDASGRKRGDRVHTTESDYTIILNMMRTYGSPVRLKVPAANPKVDTYAKSRLNAVNRALRDEMGVIGVEIDPSCKELIADMEQVLTDPRGGIRKTFNRSDPYFRRTHASDALGYWIAFEEPVRSFTAGTPQRGPIKVPAPGYAV